MVCLDTSFIVDLLRGKKETSSLTKKLDEKEEQIYISSPSIMELVKGAHLSNNIENEINSINNLLSSLVVLDFDRDSAFIAGEIEAGIRKSGNVIEVEDIMIGAIALQNNEILITKNKKHFEKIQGLKIQSY